VCGPLPTGVTVLEASAGTGKTFTIAALVARYVAERPPLEQLLVITFTRMATGELRERVRERLASAERGLAGRWRGTRRTRTTTSCAARRRAGRARCDRRQPGCGPRSPTSTPPRSPRPTGSASTSSAASASPATSSGTSTFLEDARDLVEEVVDDLYVRRFHAEPHEPALTLDEARRIAQIAVGNPLAPLVPAGGAPDDPRGLRRPGRGRPGRGGAPQAPRARSSPTTTCSPASRGRSGPRPRTGGCARLRALPRRARRRVPGHRPDPVGDHAPRVRRRRARRALVLIGDPKQAIYAFRGADVHAYLHARAAAGRTRRSRGTGAATRGSSTPTTRCSAACGSAIPRSPTAPCEAAEAHREPRLTDAPVGRAAAPAVLHRDGLVPRTDRGFVRNAAGRAAHRRRPRRRRRAAARLRARRPCATRRDECVGGASSRATSPCSCAPTSTPRSSATPSTPSTCPPSSTAPAACSTRWRHGPGCVCSRRWSGPPRRSARGPRRSPRSWAGTPGALALADDAGWEDVHVRLHDWADVLRRRGVAALLETVSVAESLPARVLAERDGERALTDLRHVGQLLHAAATAEDLGVTALAGWLRRRIAEAGTETASEERSRRLESDSQAVQVLTIHRSKGLEFPIVYFPFLWEPSWIDDADPAIYHEPGTDGRLVRTIDVGMGQSRRFRANRDRYVAEQRGEELRLLYVALTRAKHQAVLWWAGSWNSRESSLCRLLFARDEQGDVATVADRPPEDADVLDVLGALAAEAAGAVSVERAAGGDGARWTPRGDAVGTLEAARLERGIDHAWRRASYSGITAGAHEPSAGEARVTSESEESSVGDEAMPPDVGAVAARAGTLPAAEEAALRAVPSPLGVMPGGADVGTFVHRVLEHTDFAAPALTDELDAAVAAQRARRAVEVGPSEDLVAGLAAAIATPLGPLAGDRALRSVERRDRLDELWFELPLAGGDRPTGAVSVAAIADLLGEHLPAGDPLAGYAGDLAAAAPRLQSELRGYLAGSLDLVLRVVDEDGPRFLVADHKTNWLGVDGEPLSAFHYRPTALAAAMRRAHYPLQALLYVVALHRYLRWRLPGYAPEAHLGGVLYLFLRGMAGADAPRVDGQPCGVLAWRPPVPLITALSDLLDRGVER
jgi:exodeoxyribonuclease V beta subunit